MILILLGWLFYVCIIIDVYVVYNDLFKKGLIIWKSKYIIRELYVWIYMMLCKILYSILLICYFICKLFIFIVKFRVLKVIIKFVIW